MALIRATQERLPSLHVVNEHFEGVFNDATTTQVINQRFLKFTVENCEMTTVFNHPSELASAIGKPLGASDWLLIDQGRINCFAEATGDHQWIHVDPEKAKDGPFGKCIAHGYLTLSLVNMFLPQIIDVQGISMGVNYGCEKIRFPSPVPVGSKVRGVGEIIDVQEVKGGVQSVLRVTVEIEGSDRPACVVDTISRYFPE